MTLAWCGRPDGLVSLRDTTSGPPEVVRFVGHSDLVRGIAFLRRMDGVWQPAAMIDRSNCGMYPSFPSPCAFGVQNRLSGSPGGCEMNHDRRFRIGTMCLVLGGTFCLLARADDTKEPNQASRQTARIQECARPEGCAKRWPHKIDKHAGGQMGRGQGRARTRRR